MFSLFKADEYNVVQLIMRSETRYFSKGSIIADSREDARGIMVVTNGKVWNGHMYLYNVKRPVGLRLSNSRCLLFQMLWARLSDVAMIFPPLLIQVGAEIPIDSGEAGEENKLPNGKSLLYVFERGYAHLEHAFWNRLCDLIAFKCLWKRSEQTNGQ